jgi:hypothetical protein
MRLTLNFYFDAERVFFYNSKLFQGPQRPLNQPPRTRAFAERIRGCLLGSHNPPRRNLSRHATAAWVWWTFRPPHAVARCCVAWRPVG